MVGSQYTGSWDELLGWAPDCKLYAGSKAASGKMLVIAVWDVGKYEYRSGVIRLRSLVSESKSAEETVSVGVKFIVPSQKFNIVLDLLSGTTQSVN